MIKEETQILPLAESDPWLQGYEKDIEQRLKRFLLRKKSIEKDFESVLNFADSFTYFGIHYNSEKKGWTYREWAPAAKALFLTGDFNSWNKKSHPLKKNESGVWEIFLDEKNYATSFVHGSKIKVIVQTAKGLTERIPAYIKRVVQDPVTNDFTGQLWFPAAVKPVRKIPFDFKKIKDFFIYECHPGMSLEKEGVGTWREFADYVLPKVRSAGYTVLQLMAVHEHPYYASFGYHVSNFFAPSSRFGTPEDLKYLIDKAHNMGIAVIMDLVHSHTVKNINEGLNQFDGSDNQYFHEGPRGNHQHWDSKLFDYGKTEVLQFLLSNISYWMKEFRFDGFRFDGVASMLYFHHGYVDTYSQNMYFRKDVEFDAIIYLQLANDLIHAINPDAITIAEDVSGMPGLCRPIKEGGIGFDYRLGMGIPDYWIKLLKEKRDEDWNIHEMWNVLNDRKPDVNTIAYCESHDQALVGDQTIAFRLMGKEMYTHMHKGDKNVIIDRGIALHKMIRLFTISLGGQAYLNFIGNEFGHPEWIDFPREGNNWSYKYARRQWSLLDNINLKYHYLADFDREMLAVVADYNILHGGYGFQLLMDDENRIIVYEKANLIFIFNFHVSNSIPGYEIVVPEEGKYRMLLDSDHKLFGGYGRINDTHTYKTYERFGHYVLTLYIPNRTALILKRM